MLDDPGEPVPTQPIACQEKLIEGGSLSTKPGRVGKIVPDKKEKLGRIPA